MQRVSQYETREQSREDKGEDGERKNATASVESKREEEKREPKLGRLKWTQKLCVLRFLLSLAAHWNFGFVI